MSRKRYYINDLLDKLYKNVYGAATSLVLTGGLV